MYIQNIKDLRKNEQIYTTPPLKKIEFIREYT